MRAFETKLTYVCDLRKTCDNKSSSSSYILRHIAIMAKWRDQHFQRERVIEKEREGEKKNIGVETNRKIMSMHIMSSQSHIYTLMKLRMRTRTQNIYITQIKRIITFRSKKKKTTEK